MGAHSGRIECIIGQLAAGGYTSWVSRVAPEPFRPASPWAWWAGGRRGLILECRPLGRGFRRPDGTWMAAAGRRSPVPARRGWATITPSPRDGRGRPRQ